MMSYKNRLVIIDADSLIYIVGSELADMQLEPLGIIKIDEFISSILEATGAQNYLGFLGGGEGCVNFRKKVAFTKEYKGQRKEKPEWFEFWSPILIDHMVSHWGFHLCGNIEADDACHIANNAYKNKYEKVIIASPDKDLFQISDAFFYDYNKRYHAYCSETVAIQKHCVQLITGDSTDNIPGCAGAGPKAAAEVGDIIAKEGLDRNKALFEVYKFYQNWYRKVLRDKEVGKQEKAFLDKYKADNNIKVLKQQVKSDALKDFVPDESSILTEEQVKALFREQYALITLLGTEEEGKRHGFTLPAPKINTTIDWDSILEYDNDMDLAPEEQMFDFEDDL
jgi:5'-3' exonuclease